jgi:hypothetical protein
MAVRKATITSALIFTHILPPIMLELLMAKKNKLTELRKYTIQTRITEEEREQLRKHAYKKYMTIGSFLYLALKEWMDREIGNAGNKDK